MHIVYNNRTGCIRICDKSKKKSSGLLGEADSCKYACVPGSQCINGTCIRSDGCPAVCSNGKCCNAVGCDSYNNCLPAPAPDPNVCPPGTEARGTSAGGWNCQ